jgi:hypothetical protein
MDSLIHLSNAASQVERLHDPVIATPCPSCPRDGLTVPFVVRDLEKSKR